MTDWARWLPDVLTAAGCEVILEPGWEDRGRPGDFTPRGVMLHHDASPAGETSSGVDVIRDGRPGLSGPLAQLWLDYAGRWVVVAAGRANHAGEGQWGSIPRDQGNAYCIGIETDHTTDEQWTAGQRSAALAGVAAITDHLGIRTSAGLQAWFCAHKEYAAGRKVDPSPLDMAYARRQLLDYDGSNPVRTVQKGSTVARYLNGDAWTDLRFSDQDNDPGGTYAIIEGPASWYTATVQAYLAGDPGTPVQLRPMRTANVHDDEYLFAIRDYVIPADGTLGIELTHQGALSDGWWLRVAGRSLGAEVTVTRAWAEVAVWA